MNALTFLRTPAQRDTRPIYATGARRLKIEAERAVRDVARGCYGDDFHGNRAMLAGMFRNAERAAIAEGRDTLAVWSAVRVRTFEQPIQEMAA